MRFARPVLALLLLTPLLAGCVNTPRDDAPATESLQTASTDGATPTTAAASLPPKPTRTPLDVAAKVNRNWVKPGEPVTLDATSAKGTTFQWYAQLRPAAAAAPTNSGGHSGHRAAESILLMGPGHAEAPPAPKPKPVLDTKNIEPGQSKSLAFPDEGLYRLHCHPHPWMKVNVTISKDAPAGDRVVTIVDGAKSGEYRYAPEEVLLRPGARVTFENKGAQMHTATQEAYLEPAGAGKQVVFTPKNAGDYDIVVLATDGKDGFGEARTRLLVDAAKPDELQSIGPFTGSFQYGLDGAPNPESKTFSFTTPFDMKAVEFEVKATSQTPAPANVVIQLRPQGGEPVATSKPGPTGSLSASSLPAGVYELVVTASTGVLIEYEATGSALINLVLPDENAAPAAGASHH